MDEETPHVHIDFVPFIRNSKRGLDTRVSLKGALAEQGFKGGTRSATEWNQWIESEKQELSKVADRYGVRWKQLGTHNMHLSVLDYEKQERAKEVAKLEQTISGEKAELSHIIYLQVLAEEETEKIKQEKEAARQETAELSATNDLLREQVNGLMDDREKLFFDNQVLEEQQKRLQKEVEKRANSKITLERNIRAYNEDAKWQLLEPSALMSAKTYRDKQAMPLVTKLKEIIKNLTIKCVNLMDQIKQLKAKVTKQAADINFYKSKLHQQSFALEQLQEKADDFERVKQYVGADKIDTIVANARELERIAQSRKQHNKAHEMSR